MKYIITDYKDVIIAISSTIGYQSNENPIIDGDTAIAKILVKGIYEVEEISSEIKEQKYCYTEEAGFYANENYKEPYNEKTEIEKITELQLAMIEISESKEG